MSILDKNKSFILNIYIHAGKIVYQYDFLSNFFFRNALCA